MSDFGFRALRSKTHQKLQLSGMWAIVGDENGNVFDPTINGNVFVRIQYANGYGRRISVRGPVNTSMQLAPGTPVELIYTSDKRLQIKGYEPNASVAAGVNLLAPNVQQQNSGGFFGQQSLITALVTPQTVPDMTVVVKSWLIVYNGIYYEFPGNGSLNLSSLVPSSGNNRYVVVFIANDFATLSTHASTARSIADIPLGAADIQECVSAAALTDIPLAVIRLYGSQTTITNADIVHDLRQLINLQPLSNTGNVSGPASSTDRAIATWSGTAGTALRNNPNATVDASGNISVVGGTFTAPVAINRGTVTSPTSDLNITETYQPMSGAGSDIAVGLSIDFTDDRRTANLSNQLLRFAYTRAATATNEGSAFDALIVLLSVINASLTFLRGLKIEGPIVALTKTLADYNAIEITDGSGLGAITTQIGLRVQALAKGSTNYAIYTDAGLVRLGDNTTVVGRLTTQSGRNVKVRVVTAAGAVTVATSDDVVVVNKSSGAATTVNLPASPATGDTYTIKDGKGDAVTNNITLTPAAGNIDGAATFVMNLNYQSIDVIYNGTQWNII